MIATHNNQKSFGMVGCAFRERKFRGECKKSEFGDRFHESNEFY